MILSSILMYRMHCADSSQLSHGHSHSHIYCHHTHSTRLSLSREYLSHRALWVWLRHINTINTISTTHQSGLASLPTRYDFFLISTRIRIKGQP